MRLPFSFDTADGLVTVRGHVSLDGDTVVVETERKAVDLIPVGRETFRIPADEVADIEVRTTLTRGCHLALRPFSAEFVAGFPGAPAEWLVLTVPRARRADAEAFAREVRLRNLPP